MEIACIPHDLIPVENVGIFLLTRGEVCDRISTCSDTLTTDDFPHTIDKKGWHYR